MKIYKAAIIGLGPSGLAVNKLIFGEKKCEIIAFENSQFEKRDNFFGFWLTDWMKPFDKQIEKKWHSWTISNDNITTNHKDENNPYCVISFKKWKDYCLDSKNNLDIKAEKVIKYISQKDHYKIITDKNKEYFAEKIYDSRNIKEKKHELIQHFYGINITTEEKKFDDEKLTLMHFTKEHNLLHFIYLLPFSKNQALVESTVFSKEVCNEDWYRKKIYEFLESINISKYKEISSEKGIIPMFFAESKISKDPNIFNIGIRGGACKPSTGYAFSFLIKQIQLLKHTNKNHVVIHKYIEKLMDKIFLNYLKKNNENGQSFVNLAKNLNGTEFKNFMMGQSSFLTKLKIIISMPKLAFVKSLFK
ncbi:lycopene cyclase family protein [Pelagibacteraceae bacterium]|nr:lycopene cyclase family protein [Pelagibacteraceae bacterium]